MPIWSGLAAFDLSVIWAVATPALRTRRSDGNGLGHHGVMTENELQGFHFSTAFDVTVNPEFPGNGDWGCPIFGFDRDGRVQEQFESRWGAPTVVEVVPAGGERWVGQFAAGGLGGISGVFATPGSSQLCVVADGLAYVLEVHAAHRGAGVVHDQVGQVETVDGPDLLLLVRSTDIVAIGSAGVEWRSSRLALDDLRVLSTSGATITCSLDNLGGTSTITVSAATGEQVDGTRFDSFWPPDALA